MIKAIPEKPWYCKDCKQHHAPYMDAYGQCFLYSEWWEHLYDERSLETADEWGRWAEDIIWELNTKPVPLFTVTHHCGCTLQEYSPVPMDLCHFCQSRNDWERWCA